MKKIKIDRAIQERPATRKQTRNEKIRQSLTEHVDVQVIPAITDREGYEKPKLRVCAYCRVSTDMDTQALSYELQVQNYTDYIRGNDEWQFAGIYADEAVIIGLKPPSTNGRRFSPISITGHFPI